MTDPDRAPKTPDLPPPDGIEVPDIVPADGEERRDPTEEPTSDPDREAAETTKADGGDEPPD
ncbi:MULTISPECIES: hypothetical protein [unclassified Kitasatospora]|uniref:hypothetical protein n=1 Tax=unclassified Kitasatospora TaxID=2633591 RepID=UPI00381BC2A5